MACCPAAGRSGSACAVRASVPWVSGLWASPFATGSKASYNWMFCPPGRMSVAVLLTLSVVRAFAGEPATMPSAELLRRRSRALRTRSVRDFRTRRRPPEVRPTAFAASPPDYPPGP